MPRLVGYKELSAFNVWDCMFYGSGLHRRGLVNSYRLFGNANIGNHMLCNLAQPGVFPGDATAIVTNWYARTNIPEGPLRDAMFNPVLASLTIGSRQARSMSVAELLKRQEGTLFDMSDTETREHSRIRALDALAKLSYEAHVHHQPLGASVNLGRDLASLETDRWETLDDVERSRWDAVADAVYRELNPRPYLIIPVRQNFDVSTDIFNLEAFNKALVHFDDPNWDDDGNLISLLSAPKGHPVGRPGLWIHLEGWLTRDVC